MKIPPCAVVQLQVLVALLVTAPAFAQPNIVLLIGDDIAFNSYGFMGSEIVRTPTLDSLAAEGTYFPITYTPSSLCSPSNAAVLYGRFNFELPMGTKKPDPSAPNLGNILQANGYATFAAGKKWPGGNSGSGAALKYGFDVDSEVGTWEFWNPTIGPERDFVRQYKDQPWFVWLSPGTTHQPYNPKDEFRELYDGLDISKRLLNHYATISQIDSFLGDFLDFLDAEGELDDTVVIYYSDNGGVGLRRAKGKNSENGYRTPLILWGGSATGVAALGERAEMAHGVDVFPTILALAGIPLPAPDYRGLRLDQVGSIPWREYLIGQHTKKIGKPHANRHLRTADGFFIEMKGCSRIRVFDLNQVPLRAVRIKHPDPAWLAPFIEAMAAWWDPCV